MLMVVAALFVVVTVAAFAAGARGMASKDREQGE
jgi:hypothetical protein